MTLVLYLGGARSGKSALAVERAREAGRPVTFLATGEAGDEEMAGRIARHRAERPAGWTTVEEPRELARALGGVGAGETALVDCLSLWVANLGDRDVEALGAEAAALAAARDGLTVAVTNEVGMGIVPVNELARSYRDRLGRVNAIWAAAAEEAWLVVAGRRLRLESSAAEEARRAYDGKTKPRGSLGRLEDLGVRLAGIRGFVPRSLDAAIVVAAGDHGVAAEGVSAYPSEVTAQMVLNFAAGGAAINVLARQAGARLVVVDAGVVSPVEADGVRALRLGPGTASFAAGPAMSEAQARRGLDAGAELVAELAGVDVVALGEMGIGNTSSASALAAALLAVEPEAVCGRGTGLDDAGVVRKVDAVRRGLAANPSREPLAVLAGLGGFEIAVLAGVVLGCARSRVAVLLDGFITTAAALVAVRLEPAAAEVLVASHRSPEPGHALLLDALGLEPLLDLGLRLGEGSGAALALPLLRSAVAILAEMATFADAGVTDAGR